MIHHNFADKMQLAQRMKKESIQFFILSAVILLYACINFFQHF